MGLLTAITIGLELITDFLLLPPLPMNLEEKFNEKTAANDCVAVPASA